jgi:TatD DNase family protein
MKITDSHCHLDFKEFNQHREQLINDCRQLGVHRFIVPAVEQSNWQALLDLHGQFKSCFPALGIHPWYIEDAHNQQLEQLDALLFENKSEIIALGEIGIDGALKNKVADPETNLNKQIEFFEAQLQLAQKHRLPVIVHHRKSHQLLVPRLKQTKLPERGIIHGFSGSYQQAKAYLDLGFKLGIGGTITYPRAKKTLNALKRLPLDSLVLETDAPAMPLSGYQGQVNQPTQLPLILTSLSELLALPQEVIASQTEANIEEIFFSASKE